MKKHFLFFMLLAGSMIAFTGCKKDDKDEASIEGKWQLTKYVDYEYENGKLVDTDEEDASNSEWIVTLNISGGKWSTTETNGTQEYTSQGTFVRSGNTVTVKEDDDSGTDVYTIKTITDNTLVLISEYSEVEGGVTYKEVSEETYKRL